MKTILVTGGCGFIGSNFISLLLSERTDVHVINVDNLTYAGNINNLRAFWDDPRLIFYKADISNESELNDVFKQHDIDHVVNFAAESHVDRSIEAPARVLAHERLRDLQLAELLAGTFHWPGICRYPRTRSTARSERVILLLPRKRGWRRTILTPRARPPRIFSSIPSSTRTIFPRSSPGAGTTTARSSFQKN